MKRDMDLIRRIVLAVQALPLTRGGRDTEALSGLPGVDRAAFAAHAQLLEEAGLVRAQFRGDERQLPADAIIYRLTWAGHEFADSIRDETLWEKAIEHVVKPSASWTFGVLLDYVKLEIRSRLGLP